ncbi:carbonic anhydrase 2-like [Tachypleus tridentatus]|uniref:carbonic anhydrase 2-like n=1 Tax=Tachypleus tridentatus TaxID=6853 RepID=UPI003FD483FD
MLFIFLFYPVVVTSAAQWSYSGKTGPSKWPQLFPQCGKGTQSPIDLTEKHLVVNDLNFVGYDVKLHSMAFKNDGKTVKVTFDSSGTPILQDKVKNAEYFLHSLHFHWGKVNNRGSEHTVKQIAYPLELHLVHYNSMYSNLSEALNYEDGIAVVGVLFKLNEYSCEELDDISDCLESVERAGTTFNIIEPELKLSYLLPADTSVHFRYEGSLTTPMCNAATWNVFVGKTISPKSLEAFRFLKNTKGNFLGDNFRPTQKTQTKETNMTVP